MKIQFHLWGIQPSEPMRHSLQQPLEQLQHLISISTAAVVLEQRREITPGIRAFVSLAVPGPDIHAEAWDHTVKAAWLKVIADLRYQIELRKCRPNVRLKGNGHLRAPSLQRLGSRHGRGAGGFRR
ncbi:MAG TPA: hypothetical protein VL527_15140 [Dongiaceae bacterium]|jgi:hypothetical protein|nr:hypothetical protein [Dongiaceae bacterium]